MQNVKLPQKLDTIVCLNCCMRIFVSGSFRILRREESRRGSQESHVRNTRLECKPFRSEICNDAMIRSRELELDSSYLRVYKHGQNDYLS